MTPDSSSHHTSHAEKYSSIDSISNNFPYSDAPGMRRHPGSEYNYSPYTVPRRETSLFDPVNNHDILNSGISTPISNLLNSPQYGYHPSTTSIRNSEILPAEQPSRASFLFGSSTGHEPPNMTPRRYPPPSMPFIDGSDHHPHHHNLLHHSSDPYTPTHLLNNSLHSQALEITEAELKTLQEKLRGLEAELERTKSQRLLGIPPPDLQERLKFRERKFCSLNRAGNALCAWHDSRRERRMYPSRMAPYRTLNCGCTYAEALFEESLSRNGVGSFWPGESVRMDPVLRNSLLTLLQRVYGYSDGDFERNPDGTWKEGQDAVAWEQRARRPVRRERFQ